MPVFPDAIRFGVAAYSVARCIDMGPSIVVTLGVRGGSLSSVRASARAMR